MGNHYAYNTLIEALSQRALADGDKTAFTFLRDGKSPDGSVSFRLLDEAVRASAAELVRAGAAGQRAILLYQSGIGFVTAFLGCIYSGTVAVPLPPPDAARLKRTAPRIAAVARDAGASFVLCPQETYEALRSGGVEADVFGGMRHIDSAKADLSLAGEWAKPVVAHDDPAYLQYTSGSTSSPKGVIVTHGNIIHNSGHIKERWGYSEERVSLSWMPNFHDYGLVDGVIQPIFSGVSCYLMSPVSFLKNPVRWLEAISKFRVTNSGGPNFAFDYCVQKITEEKKAALDLSCWKVAHCGAEPIRKSTVDRFINEFSSCGFEKESFYAGYGLAEATLMVSTSAAGQGTSFFNANAAALENGLAVEAATGEHGRWIAGCGDPAGSMKVEIVDAETHSRCAPGKIGEVWLSDKSISPGYWNRESENQTVFFASIKETGEGPFMRTGDLGFMSGGELYITGRLKDILIIGGANHYPQDVELTVENCHPGLRKNASAAFAIEADGEEKMAIAAEVESRNSDFDSIYTSVVAAVAEEHDLETHTVAFIKKGSLPKTSSGKVQRQLCRKAFEDGTLELLWVKTRGKTAGAMAANFASGKSRGEIYSLIASLISQRTGISITEIAADEPFAHFGLSSRDSVGLAGELEEALSTEIQPTVLWKYPTLRALAGYLAGEDVKPSAPAFITRNDSEPIAIVGAGLRFPGASGVESFRKLLEEGTVAVTKVPDGRWTAKVDLRGLDEQSKSAMRFGGFISGVDLFDPEFFGITPREAEAMDPQQRLALETAWEALENAGIPADKLAGTNCGVFMGVGSDDYARLGFNAAAMKSAYAGTGVSPSLVANRISYVLDLRGPSIALDTACSSSLVAVHLAMQSLRRGECSVALAGGVSLMLSPHVTLALTRAKMLSPTGRCHVFDEEADGYVRGEGCGIVALKRLSEAQRDNDNIIALIRGGAINQDGRSNGLTAPNGLAQVEVMRAALADAGVSPRDVGYVEAHGTGTPLGDPIEMESVMSVYSESRNGAPCRIGSVKANIGHLEAAAGIAGLLKAAVSLQSGRIFHHPHLNKINPLIKTDGTSFTIPTEAEPFSSSADARFAAVSSFGFGGANAHLILENAPAQPAPSAEFSRPENIIAISAKSDQALSSLAENYAEALERRNDSNAADIMFTANTGRTHMPHRLAISASTGLEAAGKLRQYAAGAIADGAFAGKALSKPKIAFMFTGQGAQFSGMGKEFYATNPSFRNALNKCNAILEGKLEKPLLDLMFNGGGALHETINAQPAIFSLGYALLEMWRSWGITPDIAMGHSVGEYIAATAAGVFSLEDGLALIAERARLSQSLPENGSMLAVFAGWEEIAGVVDEYKEKAAIASFNGRANTVISGERNCVDDIRGMLESKGFKTQPMNVSRAFHSPLMAPVIPDFEKALNRVNFAAPKISIVSNVTGKSIGADIQQPRYWIEHLLKPVRFEDSVKEAASLGANVFLEIGPKPVLSPLGKRILSEGNIEWLSSMREGLEPWGVTLKNLGALYTRGAAIDWTGFDAGYGRSKTYTPSYPFARKRYWIENTPQSHTVEETGALPGKLFAAAESAGKMIFTTTLAETGGWIKDHRIEDVAVFPGTGYLEAAILSAREACGKNCFEIKKIAFEKALAFNEGESREFQTHLSPSHDGYGVSFYSRDKDKFTKHASLSIQPVEAEDAAMVNIESIKSRCGGKISASEFYSAWQKRGNGWSGPFAGIREIWLGDGEALALVESPEKDMADEERSFAHTALLDACGHTLAALSSGGSGVFMAKSVDSFTIHGPMRGREYFSWVKLSGASGDSRFLKGNVLILDANGKPAADLRGVKFEFTSLQDATVANVGDWLHEAVWKPIRLANATNNQSKPSSVLISTDNVVLGGVVEGALISHGVRCGALPSPSIASHGSADHADGVICIFGADNKEAGGAARLAALNIERAAAVIKNAAAIASGKNLRLWMVTRGAWSADDKSRISPHLAAVWGIAKAAISEYGSLSITLVDCAPDLSENEFAAKLSELVISGSEESQARIDISGFYGARLSKIRSTAGKNDAISFDPSSAYLVTGGLGGIGLKAAGWMAQSGAKRIILMGRTGLPPRSAWGNGALSPQDKARVKAFLEMERLGVSVSIATVDVADAKALTEWIKRRDAEGAPPVRGIIHAAGSVETSSIETLDSRNVDRNFSAKVFGAESLLAAIPASGLDFAVFMSSVSAVISSPNLGAYAAANAFVDSLAMSLSALGLNAISAGWGAWDETGMAHEAFGERSSAYQFPLIQPANGIEALERLMTLKKSSVTVFPFDYTKWISVNPGAAKDPFFSELAERPVKSANRRGALPEISALRTMDDSQRRSHLEKWLAATVAGIFGKDANSLAADIPLSSMGLDSLMAMELRAAIETATGARLGMVDLIRGTSVDDIAKIVCAAISAAEEAAPASTIAQTTGQSEFKALSFNERALWFMHEMEPESAAYHVSFSAMVNAGLDMASMRQAVKALAERHSVLRSVYTRQNGEPVRKTVAGMAPGFSVINANGWSEGKLNEEVRHAYSRPFDFENGPLARVELFAISEKRSVLLITAHHIVCDGWSLWLIAEELGNLYDAARNGAVRDIPKAARGYDDFVEWQRTLVESAEGDKILDYWKKTLSGDNSPIDLPQDMPRKAGHIAKGASYHFKIGKRAAEGVANIAKERETTPFTVTLAAFQTLLHRYTGRETFLPVRPWLPGPMEIFITSPGIL